MSTKQNRLWARAFVILAAMAGGLAAIVAFPAASAAGNVICPSFLSISVGEQHRLPDGSISQRYRVMGIGNDLCHGPNGVTLKAFCRMGRGFKAGQGYVRVPLTLSRGDVFLEICSKAQAMVEIMVTGTCRERTYVARTVDVLFGKAGAGIQAPAGAGQAFPSGLPRLVLHPSRRNYHMQTGMAYRFDYTPLEDGPKSATVFENGLPVADVRISSDGNFTYTPDHDVRLDRAGSSAWKEAVIRIVEPAGRRKYITAHTLRLHRSITAHLMLLPGLGLLGLSAAGMALMVWWKRKNWSRLWSANCG